MLRRHVDALSALRDGRLDESRRVCDEILDANPYSPRAHYNAACAASRMAETNGEPRNQLLLESKEELTKATKFGIIELAADAMSMSLKAAAESLCLDPDLLLLFQTWPPLQAAIRSGKPLEHISVGFGGGSCVAVDSDVALDGKRSSSAKLLLVGDTVMSWSHGKTRHATGTIKMIHCGLVDTLIEINNRIRVTLDHLVLTEGGWIRAHDVRTGTLLSIIDGTAELVVNIQFLFGSFPVVDFNVEPFHTYTIHGAIVHNKFKD